MAKGHKPASDCLGIAPMVPAAADAPGGRRPSQSRFAGTRTRHGRTPNGLQPALKWLIGAASQEAFPWPGLNLPPPLPTNPGLAGLPKASPRTAPMARWLGANRHGGPVGSRRRWRRVLR
jgi:hypothetical protein